MKHDFKFFIFYLLLSLLLLLLLLLLFLLLSLFFVDRQLNAVMPGSYIPEHVSIDSRIPPASAYRK